MSKWGIAEVNAIRLNVAWMFTGAGKIIKAELQAGILIKIHLEEFTIYLNSD